jgi:hypothetical protein
MFLFNIKAALQTPPQELINAIKSGFDVTDFIFVLTADSLQNTVVNGTSYNITNAESSNTDGGSWTRYGDILVVDAHCFDVAMWKLGGAVIALKLIHLANVGLALLLLILDLMLFIDRTPMKFLVL